MAEFSWVVAGLFLPLFPLGMPFNALFQQLRNAWLRALLLLAWPLAGLALLRLMPSGGVPVGIMLWALFSAALYGFRAGVVRDVGTWAGFLATSSWALIWVAQATGVKQDALVMHALAFSLPLALLVLLAAELERRYESAYAGIVRGVAQAQPRLSGILVITLLAVIGSPLFPAFFAMLNGIASASAGYPLVAAGIAVVWLSWSWSAMRLLQELLVGPAATAPQQDIAQGVTMIYAFTLLVLVTGGLYLSGGML